MARRGEVMCETTGNRQIDEGAIRVEVADQIANFDDLVNIGVLLRGSWFSRWQSPP
jgi:hypothetical protein